jgi:MFS family permease
VKGGKWEKEPSADYHAASNMSGITTTQSKIAEDLDAYAMASWFTSAYLIAMSSISPLSARLAQIFSPRSCIFVASIFFSIGGVVTSQAPDLKIFLLGRAISGVGGAGIMTISFILVLELSGKKRRGLFIGLVNTGFTTGVSLGAVIAGALLPVTGWVSLSFWVLRVVIDNFPEIPFLDPKSLRSLGWHRSLLQYSSILYLRA